MDPGTGDFQNLTCSSLSKCTSL